MSRAATIPMAESRMMRLFTYRTASAAALLGITTLTVAIGAIGPLAPTALASQTAAAASGLGFMQVLGCIGCLTGFLIGAGTTVAGLAVFLAANPELAILCATTCAAAAL